MLFPGKEWVYSTPEEQGFDSGPLREIDSMVKRAEANGVLIRNGYLVAEWNYGGAKTKQFHTMSCLLVKALPA